MRRRDMLGLLPWIALAHVRGVLAAPVVERGRALAFPADFGAHPDYRIEWWYATGRLDAGGAALGFQITFFRARRDVAATTASRFAPRQVVLAHAAISDSRNGRLLHADRAARTGFGDASAGTDDTDLRLGNWSLKRERDGRYRTAVPRRNSDGAIGFELALTPTQPLLLQGDDGYSRKGPSPAQASYYYSEPQLALSGRIDVGGGAQPVTGKAWLDHEWAEEILDKDASGWDWTGINFDDGAALMAFRIRDRAGGSARWAQATWRTADGRSARFAGGEVSFNPLRQWTSPRTGARYPVACSLEVGTRTFTLQPLFDDQELDARASTGAVYWEGAVDVLENGARVGAGYLELTGYASPLRT